MSLSKGGPATRVSAPVREAVRPVRGNWVDVAGMQVYYRTAGERGPYLLLIHGGGSDHSGFAWKYAIPALAEDFRVIAVDLPGYGNSRLSSWLLRAAESGAPLRSWTGDPDLRAEQEPGSPETSHLLSYHIEFIPQFLDAVGVRKTHVMGLSMGGGIALGVALKYPGRVNRLILVNSYTLGKQMVGGFFTYMATRAGFVGAALRFALKHSRALVRRGLRWIIHRPEAISDELVEDALQAIRKKETHPAWRTFQKQEISIVGFRTIFLDDLPRLSVPTLFLHAANDRLIPVAYARQAHQRTPESTLVVMEDVGHLIPREKPDEFHRIVREFLTASRQLQQKPLRTE